MHFWPSVKQKMLILHQLLLGLKIKPSRNPKSVQSMSPYTRTLYRYFDTLVLRNGVLYRMFLRTDGTAKYYQLIVPYVLKRQVMDLCHVDASAHLRLHKTLDQVQRRAWWPKWRADCANYLDCCKVCAMYHRGQDSEAG